jgi:hypothetical protein
MHRDGLLFLIPAALLLSSSYASAAKQPTKESKERSAKKACLAGDPVKGVEILAELYVDSNDITYIFNQGRCFEQNRRYEDAVGRFREYLVKGEDNLSDADKALAKKRIEACESYLPKTEQHSALVPEPVTAARILQPSPPPPVDVAPEPPAGSVAAPARKLDENAGAGLRITGIVVGALGVATLGAGVGFHVKTNSMASDLEKPESFNRDTDSSRKTYKTLSMVGYGVGAALLAGGSLVYILGWRSGQRAKSSEVALVPILAPGSAGALLTGAF